MYDCQFKQGDLLYCEKLDMFVMFDCEMKDNDCIVISYNDPENPVNYIFPLSTLYRSRESYNHYRLQHLSKDYYAF